MSELPDLSSFMEKHRDEWERISMAFNNINNSFQQAFQQLLQQSFPYHFDDLYGNLTNFSVRLALEGWTLPLDSSPGEISCLIDLFETDCYNQALLKFYSDDDEYYFKRMSANLKKSKAYQKWNELITQCLKAYNSGDYLITIPSLFSVLEGTINEFFDPSKVNVRIINLCRKQTDEAPNDRMIKVLWVSVLTFVEQAFRKAPFNEDRPGFINRHWVLHGRDIADWTQADSLRLFNALYTIQAVLPEVD